MSAAENVLFDEPAGAPPRATNWNRAEFENIGVRTVTQAILDAMGTAETAALEAGTDLLRAEVECPLCNCSYVVVELPWHVGSVECGQNLIDQAVMGVISEVTA